MDDEIFDIGSIKEFKNRERIFRSLFNNINKKIEISKDVEEFLKKVQNKIQSKRANFDTLICYCFIVACEEDKYIREYLEYISITLGELKSEIRSSFTNNDLSISLYSQLVDILIDNGASDYLNSLDRFLEFILDRTKTNSNVLEEVLQIINSNIYLRKPIPECIEEYKKRVIKEKYDKFFENVSEDVKEFIRESYAIYIIKNNNYDEEKKKELADLSLILGLIVYGNKKCHIKNFIINIFREEELQNYEDEFKNVPYKVVLNKSGLAVNGIEEIMQIYSKYICRGDSSDKNTKIEIYDIIKNLLISKNNLCKEFINELLNKKGYSHDYFSNFDENYEKFMINYNNQINEFIESYQTKDFLIQTYKIYKTIITKDSRYAANKQHLFVMSLLLSCCYCDNNVGKYLAEENINISNISILCDIDINNFKTLEFCYEDMYIEVKDLLEVYVSKNDSIVNILNTIIKYLEYYYSDNNSVIVTDQDTILKEKLIKIYEKASIDEKKELKKKIREENLIKFYNMPVNKLEDENLLTIANYGKELEELTKLIMSEYDDLTDSSIDIKKLVETKNMINSLTVSEKQNFFTKLIRKEEMVIDKEAIDELYRFFDEELNSVENQMDKFKYVKALIEIYVRKTIEYLNNLNEYTSNETTFENEQLNEMKKYELMVKENLIQGKKNDFLTSINMMYHEYQKMCLIEITHATSISRIVMAKTSLIPALYMNLTVNNGLLKQCEIVSSIETIKDLLNTMDELSTEGLKKSLNISSIDAKLLLNDGLKNEFEQLNGNKEEKQLSLGTMKNNN